MSLYLSNGSTASTHIHTLRLIIDPVYKYTCVTCGAQLKRKSGVMIPPKKETA